MYVPPEVNELNALAMTEFGFPLNEIAITVWERRIRRHRDELDIRGMPLADFLRAVRETTPPPGLFGTPGTMGELLAILQAEESPDTPPDRLQHARNRHDVLRTNPAYWRILDYVNNTPLPPGQPAPSG